MALRLRVRVRSWPLARPFRIAYETFTTVDTVLVELSDGGVTGRGEASGVSYHGETADSLLAQIEAAARTVEGGASREDLLSALPAGGARNALDCALWDLEARRSGEPVWKKVGLDALTPVRTVFTLGLAGVEETSEHAVCAVAAGLRHLKVKLDGRDDEALVAAVRRAVPDAVLIVDANQSWGGAHQRAQPVPAGEDEALAGVPAPVPFCADESCQTAADVDRLRGLYGHVNVKLDKTGGLTEALALCRRARDAGLGVMVGNMCGSSLGMAPGFVVAQRCDLVDLDGPLLNAEDWAEGFRYEGEVMRPAAPGFWGDGGGDAGFGGRGT
jgi:L-alanine-DL-glutamate epimerase-like enolase superfamily enzyme